MDIDCGLIDIFQPYLLGVGVIILVMVVLVVMTLARLPPKGDEPKFVQDDLRRKTETEIIEAIERIKARQRKRGK